MAKISIFNIGKANTRITELEAANEAQALRIKELEATANPAASAQLAEALASNEDIANKLSVATTENTKITASLTEATEKITKLGADHAAVLSQLNAACTALNVADGKAEAIEALPVAERFTALTGAANAAIAKTGLDASSLPGAGSKATGQAEAYKPKAVIRDFKANP